MNGKDSGFKFRIKLKVRDMILGTRLICKNNQFQ